MDKMPVKIEKIQLLMQERFKDIESPKAVKFKKYDQLVISYFLLNNKQSTPSEIARYFNMYKNRGDFSQACINLNQLRYGDYFSTKSFSYLKKKRVRGMEVEGYKYSLRKETFYNLLASIGGFRNYGNLSLSKKTMEKLEFQREHYRKYLLKKLKNPTDYIQWFEDHKDMELILARYLDLMFSPPMPILEIYRESIQKESDEKIKIDFDKLEEIRKKK